MPSTENKSENSTQLTQSTETCTKTQLMWSTENLVLKSENATHVVNGKPKKIGVEFGKLK